MGVQRPRQRLATRMRRQQWGDPGDGVGLVEDRRGRRWAMCAWYAVRCELLAKPPTAPLRAAKAKQLLRDVIEVPSSPLETLAGLMLVDTAHSEPPQLRAGRITEGPARGALVYWSAEHGDLIEQAAEQATRDVWGVTSGDDGMTWHATGGPTAALVLRRNRDRMAAALAMPITVRRPWLLEVVEP